MPDRQRIEVRPSISIFDTVRPAVAERITHIDHEIHRTPQLFQIALRLVDSKVIERAVQAGSHQTGTTRLHPKAADFITEVFANGYQRLFTYDSATKDAIKRDPHYVELVSGLSPERARLIVGDEPIGEVQPTVDSARSALSRLGFGIYIGRTAAYEAQMTEVSNTLDVVQGQLQAARITSDGNGQGAA